MCHCGSSGSNSTFKYMNRYGNVFIYCNIHLTGEVTKSVLFFFYFLRHCGSSGSFSTFNYSNRYGDVFFYAVDYSKQQTLNEETWTCFIQVTCFLGGILKRSGYLIYYSTFWWLASIVSDGAIVNSYRSQLMQFGNYKPWHLRRKWMRFFFLFFSC